LGKSEAREERVQGRGDGSSSSAIEKVIYRKKKKKIHTKGFKKYKRKKKAEDQG